MRTLLRRSGFLFVALFLTVAAHAASNVVEITYDAAGNITQLKRQVAAGFAITSFDPVNGPVGATVTIYGTGFSATPANNTVKFTGTTASVSASDSGSISTTVPTGATTGRITVTVGGNTVTSATDFVVTIPGAPAITSFTPTSGASGTTVAVTGVNFDAGAGATTVKLNGVTASATISSTTSISLTVPGATASGRISATTAIGAGVSAQDFIVPPPGTSASEIVAAVRVVPDGASAGLALGTANTRGLILFDGAADGWYTLQFGQLAVTPSSSAVAYSIIKPDNTVLATGTIGISGNSRPTIHLPKLPVSGTYSVLVSPGVATFNSNVKVVADPPVAVDGPPVSIALDTVSQSTRVSFTATAGQRIGLGVTGLTYIPSSGAATGLTLYKPDGSTGNLGSCFATSASNPYGNCDAEILIATAGVHTILVQPPSSAAAALTMQLTSEVTGTLVADSGLDVTLTRAGQDARLTFTASAGESLGLALSGVTAQLNPQSFQMTVYKPDGSSFTSVSVMPSYGGLVEMGTCAAAGTYTVVLDPAQGAFGTARLTLKTGPLLLATDPPSAFAPVTIAEAARFRFNGTAGQNLVAAINSLAYVGNSGSSSSMSIHRPDGTQLGQAVLCFPSTIVSCKATLTNLPATGVYSVVLAPPAGVKITGNASVSQDITGTLAAGTPLAVNAARDGQNARLTFAGTAGESTSVKLYGVSTTPADQSVYAYVYKPDGNLLKSSYATAVTPVVLDFGPLPATGTYQVVAYSLDGRPWQGTLALDPGATLTVNGAVTTVASATGEPLRYQFSGAAGQLLELGLAGLAYTPSGTGFTNLSLYRPGTYVYINCATTGAGACETAQAILPTTGIYSVTLVPPGANAISGGTLAVSTPLAGTFVVGDPAQTVSIQRPGQTARYTFSGTSGQLLRLNWTGVTVSGGASVQVKVLKPDGSVLSTSSFSNGVSGGFDIASLPVAGTYTVVFDPSSAATTSASLALVTR